VFVWEWEAAFVFGGGQKFSKYDNNNNNNKIIEEYFVTIFLI